MPSGRPRVPESVKKAHGTNRKDRPEPKMKRSPGEKCPRRPAKLKAQGVWFWDRWAKELWDDNWLSAKSAMGLAALCEHYYQHEVARMYVERHGQTYETVSIAGGLMRKRNPEYDIMNLEAKNLEKLYYEFGFTPLGERRNSPANIKKTKSPTAKEKKDIKQFVKGDM